MYVPPSVWVSVTKTPLGIVILSPVGTNLAGHSADVVTIWRSIRTADQSKAPASFARSSIFDSSIERLKSADSKEKLSPQPQ